MSKSVKPSFYNIYFFYSLNIEKCMGRVCTLGPCVPKLKPGRLHGLCILLHSAALDHCSLWKNFQRAGSCDELRGWLDGRYSLGSDHQNISLPPPKIWDFILINGQLSASTSYRMVTARFHRNLICKIIFYYAVYDVMMHNYFVFKRHL